MTDVQSASRSSRDPRTYDYSNPTRVCDIVMKGGATSGVVYPWTVCEVAQTFRLKNVGGTSAGAIAAAAAAAAELGRTSPQGGFRRFASLPLWLAEGTNLFDLFQPHPRTKRLFAVLTAGVGQRTPLARVLIAAALNYFLWFAAGAALGTVLIIAALLRGQGFLFWWAMVSGILLLIGGSLAGLAVGVGRSLARDVPANLFGLCSGLGETLPSRTPPLTVWLSHELDRLADKSPNEEQPLTFGDLWRGPPGAALSEAADDRDEAIGGRVINLEMITTNLTHGRPYRLPFNTAVWFFDAQEFRRLFPEYVVRWMETHPPTPPEQLSERRWWELQCKLLTPLRPLPDAIHFPVVVATRMSLSFPLLISAIPLWAVDWSRISNQQAKAAWEKWLTEHANDWPRIRDDPEMWEEFAKPERITPDRCWFSDGGIASNFPVHFFDAPLPRWPTFAINLRPPHPDFPLQLDETKNVWLPKTNRGGIDEWWTPIDPQPGTKALFGFVRSIIGTMQNWTDNTQLSVPGYRDRVAHISLGTDEGGLNLRMPTKRIQALSQRGRQAGELLAERFGPAPPPGTELTWDNHRWVRYRTTMSLLETLLARFHEGFTAPVLPGARGYDELIRRGTQTPPNSYRWAPGQQEFGTEATSELLAVSQRWKSSGGSLGKGAPRPTPELRTRPRV